MAVTDAFTEKWREMLDYAEKNADESCRVAPNSYGAGYDAGYVDAVETLLKDYETFRKTGSLE